MKYWKKETEAGTWLMVQKGFEWGNDLLCRSIEHVDGYEYETDEDGKYIVSVRKAGGNIVEGSDSPVRLQVTVQYHHPNLGVNTVFNEEYPLGENVAELTNDLHDQHLEDLEYAIYREFIENVTWGTYCPGDELAQGYEEITRQEAESLAALAGYDEIAAE